MRLKVFSSFHELKPTFFGYMHKTNIMFDRRNASEKFRLAVRNVILKVGNGSNQSTDPITELASIFRITLCPTTSTSNTTAPLEDDHQKSAVSSMESFQAENGTDWSSVLNPWLDVCEASVKVRVLFVGGHKSSYCRSFTN
jgi:hypothetical protein